MLNGQKLQGAFPLLSRSATSRLGDSVTYSIPWSTHTGVQTAKELHEFLKARGKVDKYPLFTFVVRPLSFVSGLAHERGDRQLTLELVLRALQYRVAYEGVKPDTITAHI